MLMIGEKTFNTKKEALLYYKTILNSYDFGEELNRKDFDSVLALFRTGEHAEEKIGVGINKIRIARVRYNVKCFELVRNDDSTFYFSYTKRINVPKNDFTKLREACREAVQEELRNVKLRYFKKYSKKGKVKCQETGELLKWEELTVDHRQPNTFSIIVDRFIEKQGLDLSQIQYEHVDGGPDKLADNELIVNFRQYHKEKANLRIVKKKLNMGRSYQARIERQKKDLKIE